MSCNQGGRVSWGSILLSGASLFNRTRGAVTVSLALLLVFPDLLAAAVPEGPEGLADDWEWLLPLLITFLAAVLSSARNHQHETDAAENEEGSAADRSREGTRSRAAGEKDHTVSVLRPKTVIAHRVAIERAVLLMHERLDESLTLKEMASRAFVSPYHFNRIFRQLVGIPPVQFLGALRLQEAKRLLVTTDLSVTDICFQVGYSSLGTFTRRFTSLVGFCPRDFRSLARRPPLPWHEISIEPLPMSGASSLSGQILEVGGFQGVAFLGLFDSLIPQGPPAACALVAAPGPFALPACPDGDFHLLAVGLDPAGTTLEQILFGGMPRGLLDTGSLRIRHGRADRVVKIVLREPDILDPPILTTPYLLLQQCVTGMMTRGPKVGRSSSNLGEACSRETDHSTLEIAATRLR